MQFGPVRINTNGRGPAGIWLRKSDGTEQEITWPVIGGVLLFGVIFCCCARALS